jgi:tryptophan-rich sensory protein
VVINLKKLKFLKAFLPLIIIYFLSYLAFSKGMNTYQSLIKPPLTPHHLFFIIVWSLIYLLIGLATLLYLNHVETILDRQKGYFIYLFNLLINVLWSFFFFYWNLHLLGLIWILFLYLVTFINYFYYHKRDKISGYLYLPYLIFLVFAFYLNFGILLLN